MATGGEPTTVAVAEFADELVRLLVGSPDQVRVTTAPDRRGRGELRMTVTVAAGDAGQVIGRDGRTARALRTVLKAAARREGHKGLFLEIEDR